MSLTRSVALCLAFFMAAAGTATDQANFDTGSHDTLKDTTEYIALTEAQITGAGEGGVIGNTVFQAQFAEPSIRQVDLNLPAKLSFRSNGEHITDDQHPNHQHRIDQGRPTRE